MKHLEFLKIGLLFIIAGVDRMRIVFASAGVFFCLSLVFLCEGE